MDWLLDVDIVGGAAFWAPCLLSAAALLLLLIRRPTRRWVIAAASALLIGVLLGLIGLWLAVDVLGAFGGPVNTATWVWVPVCTGGIALALVTIAGPPLWRRVVAVVAIPLFILTAGLIINAAYGITTTVGAVLFVNTTPGIAVIPPTDAAADDPAEPVVDTWTPPADLPQHGRYGVIDPPIPNDASGFDARGAQVYYPPAALVADAPRLPVVIMMMGQPGSPDAAIIASVLDGFAAQHDGLAPIAVVIDQLGTPFADPLCLDSNRGQAESYIMDDVVPWVRDTLGVLRERTDWVVAGYSNGGQCATYLGSKYPETFGSILAVSPEEFAGESDRAGVLDEVFGGDQAAYDAVKATTIMGEGDYPDTRAIFTVGAEDPGYVDDTKRLARAASGAGMDTTFISIPNADHGRSGIVGGLTAGFDLLATRLGLAAARG